MNNKKIHVLFVCTGNICRSSMAEGFFRHAVIEAGLDDRISCGSAGLIDYHEGNPPDSRACAQMASLGIDIRHQQSSPVQSAMLSASDYIIAMDTGHLRELQQICDESLIERLQLMLDYADELRAHSVPDPYYSDDTAFAEVAEMLKPAIRGLLQSIRAAL